VKEFILIGDTVKPFMEAIINTFTDLPMTIAEEVIAYGLKNITRYTFGSYISDSSQSHKYQEAILRVVIYCFL
jgi:hypothetical protein